jgi:two-component system cell cycle sensor histidine kinase/response regulator CckA
VLHAEALEHWGSDLGAVGDAAQSAVDTWVGERLADARVAEDYAAGVPGLFPGARPPARALTLHVPGASASAVARRALDGGETFGSFISSMDVPIRAATRYIPATRWGLLSQVAQSEALAPYQSRLRTEVLLAVAVLGLFGLGVVAGRRSARVAQSRDRVRAAAALEATEWRYRELVESSLSLIATHDVDGTILSLNPGAADALGLASPAAAIGHRIAEFLVPEVRHLFPEYMAALRISGTDAGKMRVMTAAGSERLWEYRNTLVQEAGREPYVLGHARDITDQHTAEVALRRSERSYRTLVERAMYGIYRSTLDGRFLAVNPALVRMLGYDSEEELLAIDMGRDLYVDSAQRLRLVESYGEARAIEGVEVEWKRKDGRRILARLSGTTVHNERGELEAFEMIAEDVTDRRTLEAQLRQAQKMEAIGQLTGGIAHDFNNLLTVILANAELLSKSLPPGASDARSDVDDLREAARRGATMVRKLLAFSRREELRLQAVDLATLLGGLSGMLERLLPEQILFEMVAPAGTPSAYVDPGAVEQILLNLVSNARDAMSDGGRLTVSVAPVQIDESYRVAHGWGEAGTYVRLSVGDTGCGMDDATLAHVFEPFFTTKPPGIGTGLGMAMVYGLVKQQDGAIEVLSRRGEGTTVHVYFRSTGPPAGTPSGATAGGGALRGGETIMLVEDEEAIRRSASRILSHFGYTVVLASDGSEALDVYRSRRTDISLVISDVVMPRMGGEELYEALQREPSPPKFIFWSGYTARDVQSRRGVNPSVPLIQKPWDMDELLRMVRGILDGPDHP